MQGRCGSRDNILARFAGAPHRTGQIIRHQLTFVCRLSTDPPWAFRVPPKTPHGPLNPVDRPSYYVDAAPVARRPSPVACLRAASSPHYKGQVIKAEQSSSAQVRTLPFSAQSSDASVFKGFDTDEPVTSLPVVVGNGTNVVVPSATLAAFSFTG